MSSIRQYTDKPGHVLSRIKTQIGPYIEPDKVWGSQPISLLL